MSVAACWQHVATGTIHTGGGIQGTQSSTKRHASPPNTKLWTANCQSAFRCRGGFPRRKTQSPSYAGPAPPQQSGNVRSNRPRPKAVSLACPVKRGVCPRQAASAPLFGRRPIFIVAWGTAPGTESSTILYLGRRPYSSQTRRLG